MTAADQSRIQAEYETFQAEETQKKAKRPRVATTPASEESGFIITDEDV